MHNSCSKPPLTLGALKEMIEAALDSGIPTETPVRIRATSAAPLVDAETSVVSTQIIPARHLFTIIA